MFQVIKFIPRKVEENFSINKFFFFPHLKKSLKWS